MRLAEWSGSRHLGEDAHASTLVADSRLVDPSVAFAAVRGGHGFVSDAVGRGAPFVVVEDESSVPGRTTAVVCADVIDALGRMAAAVRSERDYRVVGITGSIGKTLTKDLVAAALASQYRVHAAPSSYNNEIGAPLVILGCPDDAQIVVSELAARGPGQIAELCDIVRPQIGIVTGIGISHLEVFGSREAIAKTKAELLVSLPPDGLAVIPSEDDFRDVLEGSTNARIVTVGDGGDVTWRADRIDVDGRTHGVVTIDGDDVAVSIRVPGRPLLYSAALAMCVARELRVDLREAARSIADVHTTSFRMDVSRIDRWTVVNDAWNANPASVAAALDSVRELARGAPMWAVLGQMAELGPAAEEAHLEAGRLARDLGFAAVVVVGDAAAGIANGAGDIAQRVATMEEAAEVVRARVPDGAYVLVKGSRVAGLEKLPALLQNGRGA